MSLKYVSYESAGPIGYIVDFECDNCGRLEHEYVGSVNGIEKTTPQLDCDDDCEDEGESDYNWCTSNNFEDEMRYLQEESRKLKI